MKQQKPVRWELMAGKMSILHISTCVVGISVVWYNVTTIFVYASLFFGLERDGFSRWDWTKQSEAKQGKTTKHTIRTKSIQINGSS